MRHKLLVTPVSCPQAGRWGQGQALSTFLVIGFDMGFSLQMVPFMHLDNKSMWWVKGGAKHSQWYCYSSKAVLINNNTCLDLSNCEQFPRLWGGGIRETIRENHLCYLIESKYLPYVNGIYRILRGNTNGIMENVSRNTQKAPVVIQLEPSGTI